MNNIDIFISAHRDFIEYPHNEVYKIITDQNTLSNKYDIKVYEESNYLIDTHTAVSYGAYLKYHDKTKENKKTVVLSTAHPYKFPIAVLNALDENNKECDEFKAISKLRNLSDVKTPKMIEELDKEYEKVVWDKDTAYNNALKLIKELCND